MRIKTSICLISLIFMICECGSINQHIQPNQANLKQTFSSKEDDLEDFRERQYQAEVYHWEGYMLLKPAETQGESADEGFWYGPYVLAVKTNNQVVAQQGIDRGRWLNCESSSANDWIEICSIEKFKDDELWESDIDLIVVDSKQKKYTAIRFNSVYSMEIAEFEEIPHLALHFKSPMQKDTGKMYKVGEFKKVKLFEDKPGKVQYDCKFL